MNKAFELWNQSIEDMGEDIANGRRDHVYLLPGDTNYPTPIAAHPWARAATRAGEPGSSVPEGQAPPTAPPTVGRATPAVPPHDFREHVPRTTPAPSSKPTTTSEAAQRHPVIGPDQWSGRQPPLLLQVSLRLHRLRMAGRWPPR